jgi:hypothetical protein
MPPFASTPPSARDCWNQSTMRSWRMNWAGEDSSRRASSRSRSSTTTSGSTPVFRADLIVEDKVIVEIKSVEVLAPVHKKQLLTYLRLADKRLGLLINFHVALIKDGITRIVNGLEEEPHAKPLRRKDV